MTYDLGDKITFQNGDEILEATVNGKDYDSHLLCWVPSLENNVAIAKENILTVWKKEN